MTDVFNKRLIRENTGHWIRFQSYGVEGKKEKEEEKRGRLHNQLLSGQGKCTCVRTGVCEYIYIYIISFPTKEKLTSALQEH